MFSHSVIEYLQCMFFFCCKKMADKITVSRVLIFTFLVGHMDGNRFRTESSQ
jgi:hypothetical protein